MEMFYSPLNQFLMFICAWVVIYLWKWRDPRYITVMGFYSFSAWLLIGSVLGVSRDVPWMYYPNFVGVLAAGYMICLLSNMASEKWGAYSREGGLIIYIPVVMTPALLIPSVIIKYILQSG